MKVRFRSRFKATYTENLRVSSTQSTVWVGGLGFWMDTDLGPVIPDPWGGAQPLKPKTWTRASWPASKDSIDHV